MAEVFQEALTNTEQQEHAVETSNLPAPSSPSTEEQHNHKEFGASLSESQNEDNAVQEESIHESTMSVQDLCSVLPLLDTVSEQEQAGEEQVGPIEPVEAGVPTQLVGEENQQEHEQLEQEEQEDLEEELEEEPEEEELEEEEQQEEQEQEEEEQEEQEDQQEQDIQEQQSIHDHQCEVQEETASTNTSYSNTTDNNTIPQQQEEEEEEEDEEETRNTLPEIAAAPLPPVINNNRTRSASTATPSTVNGLLPRSQRVWEMDRQASECRRCHRRFNFLVRRHHCRRCGQIVCDKCSSHRIRLPVEELIEDPMISMAEYPLLASQTQRVCDTCYREPIRRSSESRISHHHAYPIQVQMRRTDSSQSLMIDCPVCGHSFLGMPKHQQEDHLQRCLNVGSPPVQSPRYIVYQLSTDSTQVGDECPICFDEFNPGDKVSRMICLCSYHQHCLSAWLQRGKGCPVHYDSLQI